MNISSYATDSVSVYLQSSDTMVLITDSLYFIGHFVPSDTLSFDTIFAFNVLPTAKNGHVVKFNLKVIDSLNNEWNSKFYVSLQAPNILINQVYVNDTQYGNGDGRFDAGETLQMWINLSNNGSVLASDIICNLATSYSGISITNTVFTMDTLKPNTSSGLFTILQLTIAIRREIL